MVFFIIVIYILYFLLIFSFSFGWFKIKVFDEQIQNRKFLQISVIIPFRNEQNNIGNIISDLKLLNYKKDYFEIIFVNDHSEDNSVFIIKEFIKNTKNAKLFELEEYIGKKNALHLGIKNAKGKLIVTTDADCRIGQKWLNIINDFYVQTNARMIICPVLYHVNHKLFSFENFQALEFLSLSATTAGSIGINKALMCNGANLAFERDLFLEFSDPMNNKIQSGDDVFFLFNVKKKYPDKVKYLKNADVVVKTNASKNFNEFFNQRIRWASKVKYYNNFFVVYTGIITFLMSFFTIFPLFAFSFDLIPFSFLFVPFLIKFIVDFPLLMSVSAFFSQKKLILLFIPLQFFYVFYIIIISFFSLFYKFSWKERLQKS